MEEDIMGLLLTESTSTAGGGIVMLVYIVIIVAFMYFVMIRPQKKEQKRMAAMLSEMAVGDCVLTTSGFYGIVIDITDDTIIVEFGSNKNCRIPMQKSAVAKIEKADAE
jgi:preprotein translocase subunit YajC